MPGGRRACRVRSQGAQRLDDGFGVDQSREAFEVRHLGLSVEPLHGSIMPQIIMSVRIIFPAGQGT